MQVFSTFLSVPLRLTFLFKVSHTWRQSKVLFSSKHSVFFFTHCLAWFWAIYAVCLHYLSLCICVLLCLHCCCRDVGLCVCVCVFLWVYCKGTGMYGSSACSSSHLLPLYASMPPHPCFTQVFVYYIIVYCSVPQLTCSDTLHCSSMNSAATGGGGEDENQDRRRVDEYRETG